MICESQLKNTEIIYISSEGSSICCFFLHHLQILRNRYIIKINFIIPTMIKAYLWFLLFSLVLCFKMLVILLFMITCIFKSSNLSLSSKDSSINLSRTTLISRFSSDHVNALDTKMTKIKTALIKREWCMVLCLNTDYEQNRLFCEWIPYDVIKTEEKYQWYIIMWHKIKYKGQEISKFLQTFVWSYYIV